MKQQLSVEAHLHNVNTGIRGSNQEASAAELLLHSSNFMPSKADQPTHLPKADTSEWVFSTKDQRTDENDLEKSEEDPQSTHQPVKEVPVSILSRIAAALLAVGEFRISLQ